MAIQRGCVRWAPSSKMRKNNFPENELTVKYWLIKLKALWADKILQGAGYEDVSPPGIFWCSFTGALPRTRRLIISTKMENAMAK